MRPPIAARRPRADPAARSTPVPDALAQAVLNALGRDLTLQLRQDGGGSAGPALAGLLQLLDAGARRHRGQPPLETDPASDVGSVLAAGPTLALSVSECAERMGCSSRWIRALIGGGRLPARKSGGVWVVDASDLDGYRTGRSQGEHGSSAAEAGDGGGRAS
jgi:excisionase family DNA binding protein